MKGNKSSFRHGHASRAGRTPEYVAWSHMKKRCIDPSHPNWRHYGGRGIGVCDRWLSFENFLADMGRRPSPGHSLDRLDNDKSYGPDNCTWSTREKQARNRRTSRMVMFRGETRSLADWCEMLRVPYKRVESRIRLGWGLEAAFTEPARLSGSRPSWHCLRCKAGPEWIRAKRRKCLRCHAGSEWIENRAALGIPLTETRQ